MKKSLIALAVLAASGAAMAQSSVTLFGVMDVGVGYVKGQDSVTGLTRSGLATSRLGFRGVEDLGNGLKVGFWLEGGVGSDDGSAGGPGAGGTGFDFKRQATVSLMGNWGEVRLGRDKTATYHVSGDFDPFGDVGSGATIINANVPGYGGVGTVHNKTAGGANYGLNYVQTRLDNTVSYFLPSGALGGLYGQIQYAFGEKIDNTAGLDKYYGVRLGWKQGPFNIAASWGQYEDNLNSNQDENIYNIGASWDFGVIKPFAAWQRQSDDGGVTGLDRHRISGWLVGLTAPIGNGVLRFSYADVEEKFGLWTNKREFGAKKASVGYVYNLSKRTALYGTYAWLDNDNGTAYVNGSIAGITRPASKVGGSNHAVEMGIRHAF